MTLSTRTLTTTATTAIVAAALGGLAAASPARADGGDRDPVDDWAPVRCGVLDSDLLEIDLQPSGHLKFVYAGDDYATCDEAIVVTSYASAGPIIDNHDDPVVEQIVFQVADLEAAGPAGVTVDPELDPCFAGIEVHRDGDTLIWDHVEGDGCAMEITTDFAGADFPTEIHVVQQTGNIEPPHIFDHVADDTTVLTGLPDGTWYVKVYEGAQPGTTMSVDGAAPAQVSIIHGVADGSVVDIEHPSRPVRGPGAFVAPG